MRLGDVLRIAAAVAAATAVPAAAAECYVIVDRANEVVYQGLTSPIDLSDAGKAARDALRGRGEQLVAMDTDQCPPIDKARITGNGKPATVEEIVAGMRPAVSYGRGAGRAPPGTGGPMSAGGPMSGMSIR